MPFVSADYKSHPSAPVRHWVCTRTSSLGPYAAHPSEGTRGNPSYCGQCVSFVTTVCSSIPVDTKEWTKGAPVKDHTTLAEGTVIATFDPQGRYRGHAAIYVNQDKDGIHVFDQWITGAGKAIGPRLIKWGGSGVSNYGYGFYVVEN
ncbi:MAG: BPSL0067 family protein [Nitrosospira sp.]